MSIEVTKVNKKHRSPWSTLEIGEMFVIPSTNAGGTTYHRQLVYAANKSFERRGLPNRFKSFIKDGTIEVHRIADKIVEI